MSAGDTHHGKRYEDVAEPHEPHQTMEPGGYRRAKWLDAMEWECMTPNGLRGRLSQHQVVEHEDGTITVSPSILVERPPDEGWHGYLERGVWREV